MLNSNDVLKKFREIIIFNTESTKYIKCKSMAVVVFTKSFREFNPSGQKIREIVALFKICNFCISFLMYDDDDH